MTIQVYLILLSVLLVAHEYLTLKETYRIKKLNPFNGESFYLKNTTSFLQIHALVIVITLLLFNLLQMTPQEEITNPKLFFIITFIFYSISMFWGFVNSSQSHPSLSIFLTVGKRFYIFSAFYLFILLTAIYSVPHILFIIISNSVILGSLLRYFFKNWYPLKEVLLNSHLDKTQSQPPQQNNTTKPVLNTKNKPNSNFTKPKNRKR